VKVSRSGSRSDERDGLVLTTAGKQALQADDAAPSPQPPHGPATSMRDDAGKGVWGRCGGKVAGTSIAQHATNDTLLMGTAAAEPVMEELAPVAPAEVGVLPEPPLIQGDRSAVPQTATSASASADHLTTQST
jgi:hypothetical protein